MSTRERQVAVLALLFVTGSAFPAGNAEGRYGLGHAIAEEDVVGVVGKRGRDVAKSLFC